MNYTVNKQNPSPVDTVDGPDILPYLGYTKPCK